MEKILIGILIFAILAPMQSAHMWENILQGLAPILYKGLELVIIVAALVAIVKSKF